MIHQKTRAPLLLALSCLAVGYSTPASASPIGIIDQQNPGPDFSFFTNFDIVGDGVTQGFTPTLNGIDALELQAQTLGTQSTLRIDIYLGDGDFGPLLGSSNIVSLTNTDYQWIHFDFPSTVPLTPNALHSFRMTHLGGDAPAYMLVTTNVYPGGIPRNPDTEAYPNYDLIFVEGLHIPEPASFALMALGVFVGVSWRKSR